MHTNMYRRRLLKRTTFEVGRYIAEVQDLRDVQVLKAERNDIRNAEQKRQLWGEDFLLLNKA